MRSLCVSARRAPATAAARTRECLASATKTDTLLACFSVQESARDAASLRVVRTALPPPAFLRLMRALHRYTPKGGNHWKWLRDNAERFADMGITAVWLPPATKGAGEESTGYDM